MRTTDDFRRIQKTYCVVRRSRQGVLGCGCCRKIGNPNLFRKFLRRQAKAQLRDETRRLIRQEF